MKKFFLIIFLCAAALPAPSQQPSWETVRKILGRNGTTHGDMFKVTYPRTDLVVKIGDVQIDPRVGLTSWAGFMANGQGMVAGDLVLKAGEVTPVVKALLAEKMEITALHNHLMGTSVPVMLLHFTGSGDIARLAASLKAVLSATGTPVAEAVRPPETVPPEFAVVQYFLGSGEQPGAVLKYNFPRNQTIIMNDRDFPGFMGTDTTLNFQAGNGKVAATGEFVVTADEVNAVIRSLAEKGITVTAVGNNLLGETPRLFFLRFWGYGPPEIIANALRTALEKVNIRRPV